MLNDTYRLLASVTVVRELYDADKSIYDVLEAFINEIIVRKRLYSFTAAQLTEDLNKEYSFNLREPIVKTCLRRMGLSRTQGEYKCLDLEKRGNNISLQIGESEENNKILFSKLYSFLERRLQCKIQESEKSLIGQSFCDFLLQDAIEESSAYTQYFHEFVLSIEDDVTMMEILQNVKEGTLIYEGIRYSGNISETGSWNSKLCLVLDTEVLFAIGGYNSSLYQAMYLELDEYLKEINRGCPRNSPKISLCYFPETKREIDAYFESAERIVRGLDYLDPTKEAMGQIVNECEKASDVQTKKTLFFGKLREHNVTLIERDFYDYENSENRIFNLESLSLHDKYSDLWNEKRENISRSLICLSHINILRKGISNYGFENCGYIFLTATGRTLKLSGVQELLKEGDVPLATSFDFLINRLWFKLNKGFGINRTPRSMDMVMRARHILASIINSKAAVKYDEFKTQYEQAMITKEAFCALNNDLRSRLKTPGEVDRDTIGAEIDDLERWNMEEAIEAQKKKELELENARTTINQLCESLDESIRSKKELESALSAVRGELDSANHQHDIETTQLISAIEREKTANRKNVEDIELLRKQLENEQRIRKDKERKAVVRKYYLICFTMAVLAIIGIGVFVYGYVSETDWAKAISAIVEISAVGSFIVAFIKKIKPRDE